VIHPDPQHPDRDEGFDAASGAASGAGSGAGSGDAVVDLLCDRALFGLGDGERASLHRLLAARGDVDDASFDMVAAQLDRALHPIPADAVMPAAILARCIERVEHLAEPSPIAGSIRPAPAETASTSARRAAAAAAVGPQKLAPGLGFAWAAGWAAAILLGAALVFSVARSARTPADRPAISSVAPVIAMRKTEDPLCAAASGQIVWDADAQRGRLVVTGLEPNDPARLQYQLWIFDATRDERFPVDGGLFDVPASGQVVIDVRPPVPIREPALFAVTVEPPGGSVVSDRRIVLVGKREG
jgi:anti-sigma-K factor RskA